MMSYKIILLHIALKASRYDYTDVADLATWSNSDYLLLRLNMIWSIFPSNRKKARAIQHWDLPLKLKKKRTEYKKAIKELEAEPYEKPILLFKHKHEN